MKKIYWIVVTTIMLAPFSTGALAQQYLVTYFRNDVAVAANRSATITSVTNQSAGVCNVSVQWRNNGNGATCGSALAVAPGQQVDFCTRGIPGSTTICNSVPGCAAGVVLTEGNAAVGAVNAAGGVCPVAVSARTVYSQNAGDVPLTAITDAKVVRFGGTNQGD